MSKPKYCSPSKKKNTVTCFSDKSLIKIAGSYNRKHKNKIAMPSINKEKLTEHDRGHLWKSIKEKLKEETPCNDDFCYLETDTVKELNDFDINRNTFIPEKPIEWYNSPNEWLSNFDITDVMRQYEDNTDFIFFGPTPIDFDERLNYNRCVNQELCTINLKDINKKKKSKIGVIFNLDPHTKSGSHWTALFVDMKRGGIYYFDSYGIEPPNEVKKLMKKIRSQGNELIYNDELILDGTYDKEINGKIIGNNVIQIENYKGGNNKMINNLSEDAIIEINGGGKKKKLKVKSVKNDGTVILNEDIPRDLIKGTMKCKDFKEFYNPKRFQYKNSECGMFSMWFIIQFIEDRDYGDIITSNIDDDYVFNKRDVYYRPNIKKIGKKKSLFGIFDGGKI
jgi:hypothetical protein